MSMFCSPTDSSGTSPKACGSSWWAIRGNCRRGSGLLDPARARRIAFDSTGPADEGSTPAREHRHSGRGESGSAGAGARAA